MAMVDHEHLRCAREHRRQAEVLLDTPVHAWAVVITFYSAYHLARWALLCDSRFQDLTALKAIDDRLIPDDRFAQQHQARRGKSNSKFGVNDLMSLMYSKVAADYVNLHAASVDVRYKSIPTWASLPNREQALAALDRVEAHLVEVILTDPGH